MMERRSKLPVHNGKPFAQSHGSSPKESSGQPSKLLMLQEQYRNRLLKEKEEKILQRCEDNQKRALEKVVQRNNSGVSVREFFKERRALGKQNDYMPPINHHYQQKRVDDRKPPMGYSRTPPTGSKKNSAGRDRANPLAPIERNQLSRESGSESDPSVASKQGSAKVRAHKRRPSAKRGIRSGNESDGYTSAPEPTEQAKKDMERTYTIKKGMSGSADTINHSKDQPVNMAKIKLSQQKQKSRERRNSRDSSDDDSRNNKLTDFQKWQQEQDRAKQARLERHRQETRKNQPPSPSPNEPTDEEEEDDDEDYQSPNMDEFRRKEQELMALIERQQVELERLQKTRAREDEEHRREEEKRRKREAASVARRNSLKAFQQRRQSSFESEEDEIPMSQRPQKRKENSNNNASENQERKHRESPAQQHKPHPPAKKPETPPFSRKARPHKKAVAKRSPSPTPSPQDPEEQRPREDPAAFYAEQVAFNADADGPSNLDLVPCGICGRKFAEERLAKHTVICQKSSSKKRKVFDMTKKRTENALTAKDIKKMPDPTVKNKKSDWRTKHENFVQTIRYAKKVTEIEAQGGNVAALPPPPPSDNPDYQQCPHCSRKFNQAAAERHIPKCKDTKSRPAPPPKRRR